MTYVWRRYLFIAFTILFAVSVLLSLNTIGDIYASQEKNLPVVSVENKTVHRGQTFNLVVTLDENPGLISMILELDYDKSVMELTGVERGNALVSHMFTTTNTETEEGFLIEPFRLLWDGVSVDNTVGTLVTLTFESRITAPMGEYQVDFIYDKQNTNSDYDKPVDVDIRNGKVTFIAGEYKVIYKNYDGTVLQEKDYNSDAIPSYDGEIPVRPADEMYSYVFNGWKGVVSDEPDTVCYIADYKCIPQEYQVLFYVDGEFFDGRIYGYGEIIDLSRIPSKKNYTFSGWFSDKNYTDVIMFKKMPAHDIILYGYMKFNVREEDFPEIKFTADEIENNEVKVYMDVTYNSGISGLVLALQYDRDALEFIGFERGTIFDTLQFSHTNVVNGYGADPFKFYWEGAVNTYETGNLLVLNFRIKDDTKTGLYLVSATCDENDATYIDENSNLWYTKLTVIEAKVPVGKIFSWHEETPAGTDIKISAQTGYSPDTILEIERITESVEISQEKIATLCGENMEVKDAYSLELTQNGEKVEINGKITVAIELTKTQRWCSKLMVLCVDADGNFILYESQVENGFIVFETNHLSQWIIVGDIISVTDINITDIVINNLVTLLCFAVLAVTVMALVLILTVKYKKTGQFFNYTRDN